MTDLLTALQRSVEAAQAGGVSVPTQRGAPAPEPDDTGTAGQADPKAAPDPPSDPDDTAEATTRGSKKATKRSKRSHPA